MSERKKSSSLVGAIKSRKQVYNPKIEKWVKINTETGKIMAVKKDGKKFKSVRKVKNKNQSL